jgi:hypothetical protein
VEAVVLGRGRSIDGYSTETNVTVSKEGKERESDSQKEFEQDSFVRTIRTIRSIDLNIPSLRKKVVQHLLCTKAVLHSRNRSHRKWQLLQFSGENRPNQKALPKCDKITAIFKRSTKDIRR